MATRRPSKLDRLHSQELVEELFEDDLHARRVLSLANGVADVLRAATLRVHAIGEGYAEVARTKRASATTTSTSTSERLHGAIAADVAVTLLADRAFGDQKLYAFLASFGWDYVIRFRGVIVVEDEGGTRKPAEEWVGKGGRVTMIRPAFVTNDRAVVPAVVVTHQAKMKEAWCLATSLADKKGAEIVALYGKRFTIEETFRDAKDLRFGMGLSATHIRDAGRRDRLLLLAALAHALLTLLGAASEKTGMDAYLKVNTAKKRTHSLFRQDAYWYGAIPNMRDDWLENLMKAFDEIVSEHAIFAEVYALI